MVLLKCYFHLLLYSGMLAQVETNVLFKDCGPGIDRKMARLIFGTSLVCRSLLLSSGIPTDNDNNQINVYEIIMIHQITCKGN